MPTVQEYLGLPDTWKIKERLRHSLVILPNKVDIRKAKAGDPLACALHNAACRQFEVPNCAIGKSFAYIPQRDKNGKPYIARMKPTPSTVRAITEFDKTGKMPEGGFEFRPVSASQTLEETRRYAKKPPQGETKAPRKTMHNRKLNGNRNKPLRAMPRSLRES